MSEARVNAIHEIDNQLVEWHDPRIDETEQVAVTEEPVEGEVREVGEGEETAPSFSIGKGVKRGWEWIKRAGTTAKNGADRYIGQGIRTLPAPGGVVVPFIILLFLFVALIQINGHTRLKWFWLALLGFATVGPLGIAQQVGTGSEGTPGFTSTIPTPTPTQPGGITVGISGNQPTPPPIVPFPGGSQAFDYALTLAQSQGFE